MNTKHGRRYRAFLSLVIAIFVVFAMSPAQAWEPRSKRHLPVVTQSAEEKAETAKPAEEPAAAGEPAAEDAAAETVVVPEAEIAKPAPGLQPEPALTEQAPLAPEPNVLSEQVNLLPEYVLSAGDKIKVTVFEDETLSGEFLINDNGIVTMPLIGDMKAAGFTQKQFQEELFNVFSQGYLVDPHISVEVISLRPFYILGEVKTPGMYEYQPSLNAFKAIAVAGGFTPRAKQGKYVIIRTEGVKTKEIEADDLTPVLPGDAIRVKERFF